MIAHLYTISILCVYVYRLLILTILQLEIHLLRGEDWDPISRLNPATFFFHVPNQNLDFHNDIYHDQ